VKLCITVAPLKSLQSTGTIQIQLSSRICVCNGCAKSGKGGKKPNPVSES